MKVEEEFNRIKLRLLESRQLLVKTQFEELDGLLNISKIANIYFNKSHSWMQHKINSRFVSNKVQVFKKEELKTLAQAYRDISSSLIKYAEQIEYTIKEL